MQEQTQFGMSVEKAYEYCKGVAKRNDTNFYLGFMFLPREKRNAVFAAYAFCRYADDIADEYDEADLPLLIDRWERDLELCYAGRPNHPITIALADAVAKYGIPKSAFRELIDGCRMDQMKKRYRTFAELLEYCEKVAVTISTISLHIFGFKDPRALEYGRNLALALQLTNIIRDVGEDARKGRIYLPLDELERFGCTEQELLNGVMSDRFREMMKFQVERARSYYRGAQGLIDTLSEDCRFTTLLMGAAYAKVLEQVERNGYDVFTRRARLNPLAKPWLLFTLILKPRFG